MSTTTTTITLTTTKSGKVRAADARKLVTQMEQHGATSRIARRVDEDEADELIDEINAHPTAGRIRIYSVGGFLPNSYRYAAPIEWLEAVRTDTGWTVAVGRGDAKRSGGNATRIVVAAR